MLKCQVQTLRSVLIGECNARTLLRPVTSLFCLVWRRSAKSWHGNGLQWELYELSMSTSVLAFLILFSGFITTLGGAFGLLVLMFEDVAKTGRVPLRYYAMMIGLISGGLGIIG